MTTADFEKIALWMGWRKLQSTIVKRWACWVDAEDKSRGNVNEKTSLTDAEALEALNRLVEKGYGYVLCSHRKDSHLLSVAKPCEDEGYVEIVNGDDIPQPTIHAVVEAALLQLISAEAREQPDTVREG